MLVQMGEPASMGWIGVGYLLQTLGWVGLGKQFDSLMIGVG